ncbi:hypothetical protein TorRG33x02_182990, partial [Trema orientale]
MSIKGDIQSGVCETPWRILDWYLLGDPTRTALDASAHNTKVYFSLLGIRDSDDGLRSR